MVKVRANFKITLIILAILVVSLMVRTNLAEASGENWLTDWTYRRSHLIGGSNGAGTNYQIRVKVHKGTGTSSGENVYANNHCRDDFGDIRFTDDDGSTLLDYWMESYISGDYAIFWVEIADNLDSNVMIYIYYGRSSATTTSNATSTFVNSIGDDFNDNSLDTSIWSTDDAGGGQTSETNQELRHNCSGSGRALTRSVNTYTGDLEIVIDWNLTTFPATNYGDAFLRLYKDDNNIVQIQRRRGSGINRVVSNRNQGGSWGSPTETNTFITTGKFRIRRVGSTITTFYDIGSGWVEHAEYTSSFTGALHLDVKTSNSESFPTLDVRWNNAYMKKYVDPEPSHLTWGSEEEYPEELYQYVFHGLYDEETVAIDPNGVNVTTYFVTGTSPLTFFVNGTHTKNFMVKPLYFHFELGANDREYWLGEDEDSGEIWIFTQTLTQYTISFLDLAGVLETYPYVAASRYVNGTSYIVERRKVDEEDKVQFSLVNGAKYDITIRDSAAYYTFGELLMTDDQTISLTLKGIEFPSNIEFGYKYVRMYVNRHDNLTKVTFVYEDTKSQTSQVACKVYFENGTIAYNTTQTAQSFSITWTSADYSLNYYAEMMSTHQTYGELVYRTVLTRGYTSNPWAIDWLGEMPTGIATSQLIPAFLILCAFGVFSRLNAYVGMFVGVCLAIALTWIGWISIPWAMLTTALTFTLIYALSRKRRRYYE